MLIDAKLSTWTEAMCSELLRACMQTTQMLRPICVAVPELVASEGHPQALEALRGTRGETSRIKVDASVCCAMTLSLKTLWSQRTISP